MSQQSIETLLNIFHLSTNEDKVLEETGRVENRGLEKSENMFKMKQALPE